MRGYPIFVPYGFRNAPEDVLKQLAYPPQSSRWYYASNTTGDDALEGILNVILQTVMSSGSGSGYDSDWV
jgi:hypothetical protein